MHYFPYNWARDSTLGPHFGGSCSDLPLPVRLHTERGVHEAKDIHPLQSCMLSSYTMLLVSLTLYPLPQCPWVCPQGLAGFFRSVLPKLSHADGLCTPGPEGWPWGSCLLGVWKELACAGWHVHGNARGSLQRVRDGKRGRVGWRLGTEGCLSLGCY